MFKGLRERFSSVSEEAKTKRIEDISEVVDDSGRRLKESTLDDLLQELQLGLLQADVALPVAEELTKNVKVSLLGKRIDKSFEKASPLMEENVIKRRKRKYRISIGRGEHRF